MAAGQRGGGAAERRRGSGAATGQRRGGGVAAGQRGSGAVGRRRGSGAVGRRRGGGGAAVRRGSGAAGRRRGSGLAGRRRAGGAAGRRRGSGPAGRRRASGGPAGLRRGDGAAGQRGGGAVERRRGSGAAEWRASGAAGRRGSGGAAEFQFKKNNLIDWTNKTSTVQFWDEVFKYSDASGSNPFQEVAEFAMKILILPHSNAEVERIFSQMNVRKSKLRNKMGTKLVNSLLHIKYGLRRHDKCCRDYVLPAETLQKIGRMESYSTDCTVTSKAETICIPVASSSHDLEDDDDDDDSLNIADSDSE
ncbi:hypothetical protein Pmani_009128 [Petrolisthes manimaculis]|uniref:HAT C-terminal dimerisation domain-containing protein n=1 Tax=Petrolisthes manimaculis TaxID=1843537 RepID=A0AAE1UIQ5_9EUCA|nr:hypothetical protein Pmani_009128 [Petrolisthes manimaculis]